MVLFSLISQKVGIKGGEALPLTPLFIKTRESISHLPARPFLDLLITTVSGTAFVCARLLPCNSNAIPDTIKNPESLVNRLIFIALFRDHIKLVYKFNEIFGAVFFSFRKSNDHLRTNFITNRGRLRHANLTYVLTGIVQHFGRL